MKSAMSLSVLLFSIGMGYSAFKASTTTLVDDCPFESICSSDFLNCKNQGIPIEFCIQLYDDCMNLLCN